MNKLIPCSLLALLLCALLPAAQAADEDRFMLRDDIGFVVSLPNVSDITVTQHLMVLQQDLKLELTQLKEEVQRKSFKAFDTLVSVFMPGGLLYAKLRIDSYHRSEQKMQKVDKELARISEDLLAFQTDNESWMVADAE